jgi:hypothetical protein
LIDLIIECSNFICITQGPFENTGFVDFDDDDQDNYADPSPLIADSFNNLDSEEIDSGLGDPQQFSTGSSNGEFNGSLASSQLFLRSSPASSTLSRQQRIISTPTRIINPNVICPPLNSRTLAKNIKNATMNHQSPIHAKRISTTLNRRSSDANP